jgi:hypothetical protein
LTGPRPPDLYARAAEAWGEGRHEESAQLLQALVESDPGHVATLNTPGEAWNDSGDPRAILILDTWNPLLTEAERAAVRLIG